MKTRVSIAIGCAVVIASCMAPDRVQTVVEGEGGTAGEEHGGAAGEEQGGASGEGGSGGADASVGGSPGSGGTNTGGSAGKGGSAGSGGTAGKAGSGGVPQPTVIWAKSWPSDLGASRGYALAATSTGELVVAGEYEKTVTLGGEPTQSNGQSDVFLLKTDGKGDVLWRKPFGSTANDVCRSMAQDSDGNVWISGNFGGPSIQFGDTPLTSSYGAMFAAKFTKDGNHLVSKAFNAIAVPRVAVDGEKNLVIAGKGGVDLGGGGYDAGDVKAFIGKLTPEGEHKWSQALVTTPAGKSCDFGTINTVGVTSLTVDKTGAILIAGSFSGTCSFLGQPPITSLAQDAVVIKADADGNFIWTKRMGGSGEEAGLGIATDGSGNVFVVGTMESNFSSESCSFSGNYSTYNSFIARLDSGGACSWGRGKLNSYQWSVVAQSGGSVISTGWDMANGGLLIEKRDGPTADIVWTGTYPTSDNTYVKGYGIGVNSTDKVFVTGGYAGTVSIGGKPLPKASKDGAVFAVGIEP